MAKDHYTKRVSNDLYVELRQTADNARAALAPPDESHDQIKLNQKQIAELTRDMSRQDPEYLPKQLERLAPVIVKLPDGTDLRSPNGVQAFRELVKQARPDLYGKVTGDLRPLARAAENQELFDAS